MSSFHSSILFTPAHYNGEEKYRKNGRSHISALSLFLQAAKVPENAFYLSSLTSGHANAPALLLTPAHFFASHNDVLLQAYAKDEMLTKKDYDAYFSLLSAYFKDENLSLKKGVFPHFYLETALVEPALPSLEQQIGRSIQALFQLPAWHKRFCDLQMLCQRNLPFNGIWLWANAKEQEKISFQQTPLIYSDNKSVIACINANQGQAKHVKDFMPAADKNQRFWLYLEQEDNVLKLEQSALMHKQKQFKVYAGNGEFHLKKKSFIWF